ncbi:hypothetical protein [Brevundimonas lutea]|uniref:hypothetical protein n=1 Tax=Brevundimonas lutea TaxID=2293980 RepID=UPI0013CE4E26|nr:hypothetical protein [Brevundimonas lutea]
MADRPAQSSQKFGKFLNRESAVRAKRFKRFQYPSVPKGAFTEQYRQAILEIACVYQWPELAAQECRFIRDDETGNALFRAGDYTIPAPSDVSENNGSLVRQRDTYPGRKKQLVLIRNIKSVKVVEGEFPAGKGLQFTEDIIEHLPVGSVAFGLSVDGAFRRWPIPEEGELNPIRPRPVVVLDHHPIGVVQRDAEIVNRITEYERCAFRERQPQAGLPELPRLWVEFTPHGFEVRPDVSCKSLFKLVDVMVGPFYFQNGSAHSEIAHGR